MKRLLIAGALAFAAVGQALAADLPEPAPPPPRAPAAYIPTVMPVYNWGGVYFGINGGYGFGNSQWSDPNNIFSASTGTFSLSGGVVGGTLGANFQTDAFVFGIEGDFDGSWIDGKSSSLYCANVGFGAAAQCETRNNWLSTLRARFGYAADRVLFYGTAGGAFGNERVGITPGGGTSSSTKAGWAAGAGFEAALADNWTARVEYLFVDLSDSTCGTSTSCGVDLAGPASQSIKFNTSLVRVGVMYKFR